MLQGSPNACSLSVEDLDQRLAEMAHLGRDALIDRRVDGRRAQLRFAAGAGVRGRVDAVVTAEAACCAFLALRVTHEPDAVRLDVDVPEGAEQALVEWVAAFGREPVAA